MILTNVLFQEMPLANAKMPSPTRFHSFHSVSPCENIMFPRITLSYNAFGNMRANFILYLEHFEIN